MKSLQYRVQSGFALLIFVVILMGLGGIALTGFAQKSIKEVEKSRFEHNREVLLQAKNALLMHAYNYAQTNANGIGPGRLPCPDTNNNGIIEVPIFCNLVGRLPWLDGRLSIPRLTDSSGETLWYAVSTEFRNTAPGEVGGNTNGFNVVNSESLGTISIFSQTGNLIYDGSVDGVAAVIIAPGPALARDEDNNGSYEYQQVRATAIQQQDPRNYLDTINGFDNSVFVNASNVNVGGFILGPVRASATDSTIVVNDQIVVITKEEVIAMAEKATLEVYRNSINAYKANVPGNRYPWLDPYNSPDGLGTFNAAFPASPAPDPVIGRLPTIFGNYFAASPQPSQVILSGLDMRVEPTVTINGWPIPANQPVTISPLASVAFTAAGDLSIMPSVNGVTTLQFYWDELGAGSNGWLPCTPVIPAIPAGNSNDCNEAVLGVFDPLLANAIPKQVIRVTYTADIFAFLPVTQLLASSAGLARNYLPAAAAAHGRINFAYNHNALSPIRVTHELDPNYAAAPFNPGLPVGIIYRLGVRYYPELPNWALSNGWHDNIQLAYSAAVRPDGDGACLLGTVGAIGSDNCLTLLNSGGVTNNKLAILIMSGTDISVDGDNGLFDNGGAPTDLSDDLIDIFEGENNTQPLISTAPAFAQLPANLTFDKRPNNGNDIVLIVE